MTKDVENKGLVLGIGNFSKPILASCEPTHPACVFAVLDCWSVVQEIQYVDNECQMESTSLRMRRDLSFFVEEPKLAVRFGPDKYNQSDTQKILRYTEDYRRALRRTMDTDLEVVISQLTGFTTIVIVTDAADEITLESFPTLIPALQNARCKLKVLSAFPPDFLGEIITAYATSVMKMLRDASVTHHQVFRQQVVDQLDDGEAKDLFVAVRHRLSQELSTLLSCSR